MKVGIVTDGKYGERAFENINKIFPCEWIQVEEVPTNVILDDYELNIVDCDLYISYLRHPDQAFALAELEKPTLLGISFGPGFLRQVQEINPRTLAFPTMCSLEPNTNIPEIDEFARYFGRPLYKIDFEDGRIQQIKAIRSSPCGSSLVGANFIKDQLISIPNLQEFAIQVCHECRAPKFGRTCDKELSGIIHIRALLANLTEEENLKEESILEFINKIEEEYEIRLKARSVV
ncbi:MAG: hypothetical protein HWN65_17850 [Candidatus Helarchaeota archaeon]|nr:hypothetical protein [Candidatus Helarchaeota archaeon]